MVLLSVFFSPHAGSNLYGERFRTSRIGIILQHNSLTHSHVAITVSTTTYTSTHSYLNWRHLLYSWFCLESSYYFHLFIHISLNFSLTSPVCLTNEVLWVWPLTDWLTWMSRCMISYLFALRCPELAVFREFDHFPSTIRDKNTPKQTNKQTNKQTKEIGRNKVDRTGWPSVSFSYVFLQMGEVTFRCCRRKGGKVY